MTVKEIKEKLTAFTDEERETILRVFIEKHLTKVSRRVIIKAQDKFFLEHFLIEDEELRTEKYYKELKSRIDKTVLRCIEIELSPFGEFVRKLEQKEPLMLDTEVN